MFCSRCGSEIPVSANSCPRCNASRGRTTATGLQTPPPTTSQSRPELAEALTIFPDFVAAERIAGGEAQTMIPGASAAREPLQDEAHTILPGTAGASGGGSSSEGGPLEVGSGFGARYHIIRMLGIGGMGAVYQAWDAELGVSVAIKVIRPEVMADANAAAEVERRFKRELLLARQVTHKNVVRIHDLGEINGIKYITMPYVDGADLSTILKREGRLPVPKVLRIARAIVSGLVEAHKVGVVHRDLKPANIMIGADDEAMIMDFGIARSTGGPVAGPVPGANTIVRNLSRAAANPHATLLGSVVGTLEYMAPEQAKGVHVDQRADVYAFGLILYDMLVGQPRAEHAGSAITELQGRMQHAPPPVKSVVPDVPEHVDQIIGRCLEPDADKRYQTSNELAADLNRLDDEGIPIPEPRRFTPRLMAASLVVVLTLLGGTWWYARKSIPTPEHEPVSVLIADFQNSTGDPAFDGTLEQALGISVEGASFITAYPRADAVRLARSARVGDRLDDTVSRLIAVREGIKVLLGGAIAREGSGYRVTVRADDLSAEPGQVKSLASESAVARDKGQVLNAVATLANRLRSVLGDTTPESARLRAVETATTGSLEALQAYSQGSELKKMNRNDEAMAAYQRAVSLDPAFGRAYAGIGDIYTVLKDEAKAKAAFDEALKYVDRMSEREKYRTYGNYYLNIAHNNEKAIENYEAFVKLYPADDGGHGNLGLAYLFAGNLQGAIIQVREALRIYPKNLLQRYNYAMYSMYAGDFDTASSEAALTLKESPTFSYAFLPIALSAAVRRDFTSATETYGKLEQSGSAGALRAQLGLADLEMYRGRHRQALNLLQPAVAAATEANNRGILAQDYVALAQVYLALGQKPRAVDAALKAASSGAKESVLVPAALVLLTAGRTDEAKNIAQTLEKRLQTQAVAYSRLITAEIALKQGRYVDAVEGFNDSIKRRDTWLARYLRGRAYVESEHPTEAMDDLGLCVKRLGEATDVFFDDTPTLRYLPSAYYWLARAQQAVHVADAKKNYEQFLALTAEADPPDPLAADARRRMTAK
jgi:eukaryotic-like serine/threonine-protein kinase